MRRTLAVATASARAAVSDAECVVVIVVHIAAPVHSGKGNNTRHSVPIRVLLVQKCLL